MEEIVKETPETIVTSSPETEDDPEETVLSSTEGSRNPLQLICSDCQCDVISILDETNFIHTAPIPLTDWISNYQNRVREQKLRNNQKLSAIPVQNYRPAGNIEWYSLIDPSHPQYIYL